MNARKNHLTEEPAPILVRRERKGFPPTSCFGVKVAENRPYSIVNKLWRNRVKFVRILHISSILNVTASLKSINCVPGFKFSNLRGVL